MGAVGREQLGQLFDSFAGGGVDDAGLPLAGAHHRLDLLGDLGLPGHRKMQVGPVERPYEASRLAPEQLGHDFLARAGIGRGGDGDHLRVTERIRGGAQLHVFRAKVVAPLRDAMGLVDGEAVATGGAQRIERAGPQQPFRRDVDEPETPRPQRAFDVVGLGAGVARV